MQALRCKQNPILSPNYDVAWESQAAFNGCILKEDSKYTFLYRALSPTKLYQGIPLSRSTIGIALGKTNSRFSRRKQFIFPEKDWERYGCEDPRVTKIDGKYYIFYTAISTVPPSASGIKVGVAITKSLSRVEDKHLVTPFNAKAMALFSDRISGRLCALLTVHTDLPPVKIAFVSFPQDGDIWNPHFWNTWHANLASHEIPVRRSPNDHIEIGAPPLKTKKGWLLVYCHIQNYTVGEKLFRIDGLLLDLSNPRKVIGQTKSPYLTPKTEYELHGDVPNVIFPSGALIENQTLYIYYGASDTTCAMASLPLKDALAALL